MAMGGLEEIMSQSLRLTDGVWVSKDFERVAGIIQDTWNGVIELAWIPPAQRTDSDIFPFCVIENCRDGSRAVVCYLSEAEINVGLIERLFQMGTQNAMERVMASEVAQQTYRNEVERERRAELHDKAKFMWNSPLHTLKMDGKVHHL